MAELTEAEHLKVMLDDKRINEKLYLALKKYGFTVWELQVLSIILDKGSIDDVIPLSKAGKQQYLDVFQRKLGVSDRAGLVELLQKG